MTRRIIGISFLSVPVSYLSLCNILMHWSLLLLCIVIGIPCMSWILSVFVFIVCIPIHCLYSYSLSVYTRVVGSLSLSLPLSASLGSRPSPFRVHFYYAHAVNIASKVYRMRIIKRARNGEGLQLEPRLLSATCSLACSHCCYIFWVKKVTNNYYYYYLSQKMPHHVPVVRVARYVCIQSHTRHVPCSPHIYTYVQV